MKDEIDPLGSETAARLNLFEYEQLEDHAPLPQKLIELAEKLGGPLAHLVSGGGAGSWPVGLAYKQVLDFAGRKAELNFADYIYYIARDLDRHGKQIDELKKDARSRDIYANGAIEASRAATEDKVSRLAAVVVSGLLRPKDAEEMVLEFIRISSQLTTTDTHVLSEINKHQKPIDKRFDPDISLHELRVGWARILSDLKSTGVSPLSYRSAFVRLQSFGLIERMQPGQTTNSPRETPYEILELGEQYLAYLSELNAKLE